jgi:hypothetical protein
MAPRHLDVRSRPGCVTLWEGNSMSTSERRLDRRQFLGATALGAFAAGGLALPLQAKRRVADDPPNTHNMLVVGVHKVFLSHLPMFDGLDRAKAGFRSPHRFQVIVEAAFTKAGKDVSDLYVKDRQANPKTPIYTLNPDTFVLTHLFTPREKPRLTTFSATVFRGHLENGGKPIAGLEKIQVTVSRVVHGRMFEPGAKKPGDLEYVLFGTPSELLLAHTIFSPPDFDQVLTIKLADRELTEKDLSQDVRIVFQGRKNAVAERLREKERVPALLRIGATAAPVKVQVEAGPDFYFEEGELLVPPTFDPTTEETKRR